MQTSERLTYSVREAAQMLGLSKNSVYQAVMKGQVPHVKIGKRILIPKAKLRLLLGDSEIKDGQ